MVYDHIIRGRFVDLRSITIEDAEFSYNIRSDKNYSSVVGQPAVSLEKQKQFIEWQMKQPGDYYFVVLNKNGDRIGLTGVYDINGDMGEVGREVSYGNPCETMETEILLNAFCRDVLHLKKVCYVVYMNNKKVLHMQEKNGMKPLKIIMRSGIKSAYYERDVGKDDAKIGKLLDIMGDELIE